MSASTPSTDVVRGRYCDGVYVQTGHTTEGEDFDRWLTQHDLKVAANALRGFAAAVSNDVLLGGGGQPHYPWSTRPRNPQMAPRPCRPDRAGADMSETPNCPDPVDIGAGPDALCDAGFIPTTHQVREAYEVAHEEVGASCDIAGFDRWLNDIIQQAKAEAWDAGYTEGVRGRIWDSINPYQACADGIGGES